MLNTEEFRKAAEQGNADAQYKLGLCYHSGQDYVEAVKWYKKAAFQGDVRAIFTVGICYFNGLGVNKDLSEGISMV